MNKGQAPGYLFVLLSCVTCISVPRYVPAQPTLTHDGSVRRETVTAIATVFAESLEGSGRLRRDQIENYYVLNTTDSTILMYDRSFRFLRRISSFGQGPDDLNHPLDFTIDKKGHLIIADTGNNRIQIMSIHGQSIHSFKVGRPVSVDTLSTGEVLVVGESSSSLIGVFSNEGQSLRGIGEIIPTGIEEDNLPLHFYVNRGRLFVDRQDNIYWTGVHLVSPTIRKYSRDGKLLLEIHPGGPSLHESIVRAEEKLRKSTQARTVSANATLNGAQVDSGTGDIWVLPAAPLLQIYDKRGNFKRELLLMNRGMAIGAWGLLGLDRGRFIVSNQVLGCYLFKLDLSTQRRKP